MRGRATRPRWATLNAPCGYVCRRCRIKGVGGTYRSFAAGTRGRGRLLLNYDIFMSGSKLLKPTGHLTMLEGACPEFVLSTVEDEFYPQLRREV